jgi:hypothetical protein
LNSNDHEATCVRPAIQYLRKARARGAGPQKMDLAGCWMTSAKTRSATTFELTWRVKNRHIKGPQMKQFPRCPECGKKTFRIGRHCIACLEKALKTINDADLTKAIGDVCNDVARRSNGE